MPAKGKKKVAVLTTVYHRWSHSDIIAGKLLEGFNHDGKEYPALEVVSMYVDQAPKGDTSRALARRYGFPLCARPEDALTRGGKTLAVDGVLLIGEHGTYPTNKKGQILYPRRAFFEAAARVFEASGRSVPVFNDKHLAASWADAKWVYDRARHLHAPLLAGSSLPLTWRRPVLRLPRGCELAEAVQIGYGPTEGYGFHALEALQCMVERRKGGEVGVRSVQYVSPPAMWRELDRGAWSRECLDAATKLVSAHAAGGVREWTGRGDEAGVILVEYRDGFRAAVAMLNGWVHEGDGGAFIFAGKLRGKPATACQFWLQNLDPFGHFAYLVRAIDSMVQTGHPPYPVERTLLTTGILDAAMTSKAEKGRKVDTPHLAIKYAPTDWPFATAAVPKEVKR